MKSHVLPLFVAALLAGPSFAQQKADDHSAHHPPAAATADMTDGEVRKIDKEAGKMTIKHGEIKNLEMPAMTMVFQVKEVALLDKVKAGDKVKFRAEKAASGYVVTAIESAK
ncbi:MAG: copper-binding protein [Burkholderiaceae bacterium]|nr:copper-binding protein [Burkholderiaceae bacterium]